MREIYKVRQKEKKTYKEWEVKKVGDIKEWEIKGEWEKDSEI